jgi:diguanylate cyclase (GGDEF)-like protein
MPGTRAKISNNPIQSSLAVKICLMSMLILATVFTSYAYVSCLDSILEINKQYKEKAISIITATNSHINSKTDLDDIDHIQRAFDELKKHDKGILKISLYVKQGNGEAKRVVSSAHDEIGKTADDFDIKPIETGEIVWEEEYESPDSEESDEAEEEGEFEAQHIVEILAPVAVDGKRQASIGVYMDLASKDMAVAGYIKRAVSYALIALTLIVTLLYMMLRRELFKPLRAMTDGVKEVAIGNLNRKIDLSTNNELGQLSKEFDAMTEALSFREEENKQLLNSLKEKWIEAEEKSHIDYLTGLENHRSFQDRMDSEINLAARSGNGMSVIFCDLDSFKAFNDVNGHQLGDRALFEVAEIIKDSIRNYDVAARYGGEEFAVIMPQTGAQDAFVVAERIRANVEEHLFSTKFGLGYLTISIGVATFPEDANNKDEMIAAADQAMYASKYAGKNRVSLFADIRKDPSKVS